MADSTYRVSAPQRWLYKIPVIGKHIRRDDQKQQQAIRDKCANQLRSRLLESGPSPDAIEPFYLYLRPFTSTGKLYIEVSHKIMPSKALRRIDSAYGVKSPHAPSWSEWRDLETVLGEALECKGPLVALGQPGQHIGAGYLATPDSRWKHEFELLTQFATAIFMLPASIQGALWEFNQIRRTRALLSKTIFIVPPTERAGDRFSYRAGHSYKFEDCNDLSADKSRDISEETLRIANDALEILDELGLGLSTARRKTAPESAKRESFSGYDYMHDGLLIHCKTGRGSARNRGTHTIRPIIVRNAPSLGRKALDSYLGINNLTWEYSVPALRAC